MKPSFRPLIFLCLMIGNACSSNLPVANANSYPQQDKQASRKNTANLEARYSQLEKKYEIAKKEKIDLSSLNPLISEIGKAKKQRDLNRLSTLLDQFEKELADTYRSQNSSQAAADNAGSSTSNHAKPDTQIDTHTAIEQENLALQKLAANKYFKLLHNKKGPTSLVAGDGAVGRNKREFSDVATQRDSLWVLRNGMITNDSSSIGKSVQGLMYAFKHQSPAGNFNNGLGYNAVTAAGNDAFFISAYAYGYLLLKNDPRFSGQFNELRNFEQKLGAATNWLEKNRAELYRQDGKTPNRLLFDGMAFYFSSEATGIEKHKAVGREFIYQALAAQKPDGTFVEKGGYDSSYQAVNMLNLSLIYFHTNDDKLKRDIKSALERAATWLAGRIDNAGKVSAEGNTRTGLGQEIQSGKPKDINYPEVALSLYYSALILNRPNLITAADKVVTYADAHF